ncbi:MAG: helix-turn-helix transcriptional regulator [Paenibacillaceae bacterium]
MSIELTSRQLEIVQYVRAYAPITGDKIAEKLGVGKATIRSDFSILVMLGYIDAKPKVGYFLGEAITPENRLNRKLLELKVKDIQGIPVVVRDTSSIHDAVVTLFLENVGSLMVIDSEDSLIGIVSRKDLLKVTLGNPNAPSMLISLVMTRQPNIVTIGPDDSVFEAARRLISHQIDSLPVVIASESVGKPIRFEVVGRITKTNLTRTMLELALEP